MADTFVHFEIPANDPAHLKKFYGNVFQWTFQDNPMPGMPGGVYTTVMTTEQGKPGINGGLYKKMGPDDKPRTYVGVSNIDATLKKVTAQGGNIVQPKMAIPNIGWFAMITDPEGNPQGIFQDDQKAK